MNADRQRDAVLGPDGGAGAPDRGRTGRLPLERRTPRAPLILLGLVVLAAIGWVAVDAFRGSVVYYLTPTEAVDAAPDQVFRLAGHVADGSIHRDAETGELRFAVTDGTTTIPVRFGGWPPDSLADGAEAVAEGRFAADGSFAADTVLTRCASRFEAEWEEP
jgi:cytochrome c-type biogenesis protein CcmE